MITELRLNNFVAIIPRNTEINIPAYDFPMRVLAIEPFKLKVLNYDKIPAQNEWFDVDVNDIAPLPITEEWLLKFGFRKKHERDIASTRFKYQLYGGLKTVFNAGFYEGEFWFQAGSSVITSSYDPIASEYPLRYVHQLQNYYFALVGKELTTANT